LCFPAKGGKAAGMCESCLEIDKKIAEYRESLRPVTDKTEIERINRLIYELYGERVRKHQNPEK
jgi:hypothetical protein